MKITQFELVKDNWWRNLISHIYDIERVRMLIDGQKVTITWHGFVTFWDGTSKDMLHLSYCSPSFISEIAQQIKNNS
jgi:hypothetical protein